MSDFEDRLTTALHSAGDDAPDGLGLAGAARRRARARRRRTALTSTAVVAAVVAVVGGVALLGNGDDPDPVADRPSGSPSAGSTSAPEAEPTERVESWRDLQVTVPVSWGHGTLSGWCSGGATEPGEPVVERAEAMRDMILCTEPANGYGVMFFDGSAADLAYRAGHIWKYEAGGSTAYPADAWLGYQRGGDTGDNIVMVIGPDHATTERVLASFEPITGADANGCTPHPVDPAAAVVEGTLRLCRYGVDDWLEQSELLTGQDAEDARAALEAAPEKGHRMCTMALTGPVVLAYSADTQGRITLDACQGFAWGGQDHDLTSDVLFWMLTPGWSGGVEGDVPLPDPLRG